MQHSTRLKGMVFWLGAILGAGGLYFAHQQGFGPKPNLRAPANESALRQGQLKNPKQGTETSQPPKLIAPIAPQAISPPPTPSVSEPSPVISNRSSESEAPQIAASSTAVEPTKSSATKPAVAVLLFDPESARLKPDSRRKLQPVIDYMKSNSLTQAILSGYHGPTKRIESARELALKRAEVTRSYLEKQNISTERIIVRQSNQLLGTGSASQSRRVEVKVELLK